MRTVVNFRVSARESDRAKILRRQSAVRSVARASTNDGVLLRRYQGVGVQIGFAPWTLMYQNQTAA